MKIDQRYLRALLVSIPALIGCALVALFIIYWLGSRPALYKHASSIDSYSTWSMYSVDTADTEKIIDKHHDEMALVDDYLLRTKDVEQATRSIFSIVIRSPTTETPDPRSQ